MGERRFRVSLDANVLVAGVLLPRWPHEVMKAALSDSFDLVLPEQVIIEARRHLKNQAQVEALEFFLAGSAYEVIPMPAPNIVAQRAYLVRSMKDVPIALALIDGKVDVFVTSDRDFTDPDATDTEFNARVTVMLPGTFLRQILNWDSDSLESIRHRTWHDVSPNKLGDS